MCCACKEEKARVDDYYNTCEETTGTKDKWGDSCSDYVGNEEWCGGYDDEDFNAFEDCCACKFLSESEKIETLNGDFYYEEWESY